MVLAMRPSPPRLNGRAPIVDHRQMPIIDALRRYAQRQVAPFSTPGHKLGAGADSDLRELLGDRLFAADVWLHPAELDQVLSRAEALATDAWGADRSYFLLNGSSSGNQAFLLATLQPGDEVIVARDLHTSLLTALILTGARPVYVMPRLHAELDVGLGIAAGDVAATLATHPAAKLVALVSPTYWGVTSDLTVIAGVAHARGVPLYVDEAWGPHFPFHPDLPPSAMASGADAAVTSVHKLLAGLSQAALLNIRTGRIDPTRIATTVRMTRSTSPFLPILASTDACRRQMALEGRELLKRAIALADSARRRLQAIPGLTVLDGVQLGLDPSRCDPCRLVVDVHGLGLTGYEAERALRERFRVVPEMSDRTGVICLITIGDTAASIHRLVSAVGALAAEGRRPAADGRRQPPRSSGEVIAPGPQAFTPREAFFAPTRAVALAESAGEVAAELVVPYPPGIPVLVPGEVITAEKLTYLRDGIRQGMHICGPADPTLATIRIVTASRSHIRAAACVPENGRATVER